MGLKAVLRAREGNWQSEHGLVLRNETQKGSRGLQGIQELFVGRTPTLRGRVGDEM